MVNTSHNHSKDYNLNNYRKIINLLKTEGYFFAPFTLDRVNEKTVFLRHDIDYSPHFAEKIARINCELQVRGTFFFQIRSPLYNLMSFHVMKVVQRIIEKEQYIGFHYTVPPGCNNYQELANALYEDYFIFKGQTPECHPVFAWHNPSDLNREEFDFLKADFSGLVNVYGKFAEQSHPYYADSNMRYSVSELIGIINKGELSFQLALSPMQWCPDSGDMLSILADNLIQKIRDLEIGFMENSFYKKYFPKGLPKRVLRSLKSKVLGSGSEFLKHTNK